ncbi:pimeloyl-ACP methyl ester carboxylesterase [Peribacillus sp. B2I2]|uniref:hydrolase n=1 Tax=Peribacillus sp. B2I2 TaxID=3156468 RepID=UPI003518F654
MEQRIFQIDDQWNIIYYPERPSGFSVMVIGDRSHFVEKDSSFWLQHPGRLRILEYLKEYGYTLFSSNFHGANWGSPKAMDLSLNLYILFMKKEIVNQRFHILAEGTGALLALKLMNELGNKIRSVVLIDPVFSLKAQLEKEKENKFFYKKWLSEVAAAYELDPAECEQHILDTDDTVIAEKIPMKVIQVFGSMRKEQASLYREIQLARKADLQLTYLLPEKRYKIPYQIQKFFNENEESL